MKIAKETFASLEVWTNDLSIQLGKGSKIRLYESRTLYGIKQDLTAAVKSEPQTKPTFPVIKPAVKLLD